jgi:hypothetical protein
MPANHAATEHRADRARPHAAWAVPLPAAGSSPARPPAPPDRRRGALLVFVRYVLPATVVLAGVVAMAFGTDTSLEGGAGLISAGVAIWLLNWLFRIGARGDAERAAEDRAREYFDRHGHWPPDR